MSRAEQRANRIREKIPILDVLVRYGYPVHPEGGDREQQFTCDLHGDGSDRKPSARVYPQTNSIYCFACNQSRDAIRLVMAKEGIDGKGSFSQACSLLEQWYGLPPIPYDPTERVESDTEAVYRILSKPSEEALTDIAKRVYNRLTRITTDRELPMLVVLAFWEAYDMIRYQSSPKGSWTEEQAREAYELLIKQINEKQSE